MSYLDLLRSQGEVYLKQLCEVVLLSKKPILPLVMHEFFGMGTVVEQGKQDCVLNFEIRK
jgi:hypothetical protein